MASQDKSEAKQPARRDFLELAGGMFAAVGGAATLWPLIQQMNPDASALALASTEVDLTPIKEGQAITVMWRGKPVFIRNRTKDEIAKAKAVSLDDLRDTVDELRASRGGSSLSGRRKHRLFRGCGTRRERGGRG